VLPAYSIYEIYCTTEYKRKTPVKDAKIGLTLKFGMATGATATVHIYRDIELSSTEPFTIDQFYKNLAGETNAGKCLKCGEFISSLDHVQQLFLAGIEWFKFMEKVNWTTQSSHSAQQFKKSRAYSLYDRTR